MIRSCFELEMGLDVPIDFDPECDDAVEIEMPCIRSTYKRTTMCGKLIKGWYWTTPEHALMAEQQGSLIKICRSCKKLAKEQCYDRPTTNHALTEQKAAN